MDKIRRKEILILILCFIVGFALRFYTFDKKSLWLDEIYTFNDSRYGLKDQLKFYEENPTFLHPPFFFLLTHIFYPFTKPERDLRIIPLIFGTLSILMIYLLSQSFCSAIVIPCTLSLTFMAYHISLSQDGRAYSFLMFLAMNSLYFFMKYLKTLKKIYLIFLAFSFAVLFHTSYSSIPLIILSQILWFYRVREDNQKPNLSSPLLLNALTLLLCLPWILFLFINYKGKTLMDPLHTEGHGSVWSITYGVFHDWVSHAPLMIASAIILILFPFFSKNRRNTFVLLALFITPIGGLYLFCEIFNVAHFITSRYFISFLPLFFISTYLSLDQIEVKFERLKRFLRLRLLFVTLFIASNLFVLPLYYRAEKQDIRSLVNYLKGHLQDGDKVVVGNMAYIVAVLHYFGVYPEGRHYVIPFRKVSGNEIEYRVGLINQGMKYTITWSYSYWWQYFIEGNRLWIVGDKKIAKKLGENFPCILKGYFDGSFLNFDRFPTDASMYLFLWDPHSPDEKGIDMPIE